MKKILWTLALLNVMAFAVHPALQEAIDSKNYKQAENLIKNVGIKDVYCPETLAAKDADKIYGKVFAESIKSLLENCDAEFSRNYLEYKCAGGKDKAMCLNLINLTDPNSWPETYAKQFCTKKNVEICAAAVEKISVEKSVPYLKAIKANKLAEMKGNDNSIAKTISECRRICEIGRTFKLSGQLDDEIFKKRQEWRRATTVREQQGIEQQIRRLEKEKVEIRSNDYCEKSCPGSSQSKSKLEKFSQYYFEKGFYSLSNEISSYYKNMSNPIIPELAENWSIVDKLIDISLDFFMKNVKDVGSQSILNTDFGLLNILLERQKELAKLYPYVITKRFVMDTLKASFANGKNIKESDQLFYCKIYPSLEKETEKLFGNKILNCKALLTDNKKIFEPCHEGDSPLFEGKFQCEETLNGWKYVGMFQQKRVGKYFIMTEHAFDAVKHECPAGWRWPNSNEMAYVKTIDKNQVVSCMKIEYENEKCEEANEGECFDEYCCENGRLRKGTDVELSVGKICSISTQDSLFVVGEIPYLCDKTGFVEIEPTDERFLRLRIFDSRDGKIYRKIKIGNQIWMAENLNYETNGSYCYDRNPTNCTKYGRLYNWYEAQKVCPTGWHLPSEDEFNALSATVGGKSTAAKMLKSQTGWKRNGNGTDAYGFAALPAGEMYRNDFSNFSDNGNHAYFWSATENPYTEGEAYRYSMNLDDDAYLYSIGKGRNWFSVRCLKD